MTAATIQRPELTMPEAEGALLRGLYERAEVILEYGSGGSTVLASELPGKTVFTVESDQAWAQMMRDWLAQNPPAEGTQVEILWSDVGPTKDWGYPQDDSEWRRYVRYPLEVWGVKRFRQPDVVLVDGRFRIGCALATLYRTTAPVTLLFDDYVQRKHYHKVEDYLGPPRITGRMAEFRVTPAPIPPERLMQIVSMMQRP